MACIGVDICMDAGACVWMMGAIGGEHARMRLPPPPARSLTPSYYQLGFAVHPRCDVYERENELVVGEGGGGGVGGVGSSG